MTIIVEKIFNGRKGLIVLSFIAFIALGMPDGLLGVGWPSIRAGFSLDLDALGPLLIAATAGYLTSSFFNGKFIAWLGVGGVLTASCAITGLALIGYTLVPSWWMMVALGVVVGLGAGAVDAGLNTYVASHFGKGWMQWLHASYGIGVTTGPIIMTVGLNTLDSWRFGYTVVGMGQLALSACFALTLPLWEKDSTIKSEDSRKRLTDYKTPFSTTLEQPRVWLSLLLFFLYTGAEVGLGAWGYSLLTESRGITPATAGLLTGSYWAMFTIGRILAGLYARRNGLAGLMTASLAGAITGVVLLWLNPFEFASLFGIGLTGFAIAPIFPALVSGTSQRVDARFAANTIGMQTSAAGIGAAAIPGFMGVMAKQFTLEVIPVCLFIFFMLFLAGYLVSKIFSNKTNP